MTTTRTQEKRNINWWNLFVRLQNPLMKWLLKSPLACAIQARGSHDLRDHESQIYLVKKFVGRG